MFDLGEWDEIYRASCAGDLETVKDLLVKTKDIKEFLDTAIIWSSSYGRMEIVKFLVENGAVPSHGSMWWAACGGHLEVLKFLAEKGENLFDHFESVLVCASASGHIEVVKYLIKIGVNIRSGEDGAIWWASENEHLEVVKYLKSLDKN